MNTDTTENINSHTYGGHFSSEDYKLMKERNNCVCKRAYDELLPWLDIDRNLFILDWRDNKRTGKYKKHNDSPFYRNYVTIVASLNALTPLAGYGKINVNEDISLGLAGFDMSTPLWHLSGSGCQQLPDAIPTENKAAQCGA